VTWAALEQRSLEQDIRLTTPSSVGQRRRPTTDFKLLVPRPSYLGNRSADIMHVACICRSEVSRLEWLLILGIGTA